MESSDLKYKTTSTITQLYMVNLALPSDRREAKELYCLRLPLSTNLKHI